eukprot:TRINITY_DN2441_c0_g2_i1.p1 TRINITY_DN2441_c0_g2~~TRINITY_DN2441_c0_g2_i1.p1  ORF type:complete len:584 (+),score=110.80 TRINITY_DN2441_c0_g2_i1:33-1784(+)
MCNGSYLGDRTHFVRNYDIDLSKGSLSSSVPDVIFVTKEKMQLKAHRCVLSQDKFWLDLFKTMLAPSLGLCSGDPLVVLMTEYTYGFVSRMIKGYYKDWLFFTKEEHDGFLREFRSFNKSLCLHNGKCRICDQSVGDRKILGHVLDHIKDCASNDVAAARSNPEATIHCSFGKRGDKICSIEPDRATVTNGIFNDALCKNVDDLAQLIKEHYRRHLRDEIGHLRNTYGSAFPIPSDTSLYDLADISDIRQDDEEMKVVTDRLEDDDDDEDDNYSGGLSSPEPDAGPASPQPNNHLEYGDQVMTEGVRENNERSTSGSRRTSVDMDEGETPKMLQCKTCSQKLCKQTGGFKKHLICKHVYDEFHEWLTDKIQIDEENPMCTIDACKKKAKKWTNMKLYVAHMGTVHNLLDDYLKTIGKTLMDYYDEIEGSLRLPESRPSSCASQAEARISPVENVNELQKISTPEDDDASEADSDDSIWGDWKDRINSGSIPIPMKMEGPHGDNVDQPQDGAVNPAANLSTPALGHSGVDNINKPQEAKANQNYDGVNPAPAEGLEDDSDSESDKDTIPAEDMEVDDVLSPNNV